MASRILLWPVHLVFTHGGWAPLLVLVLHRLVYLFGVRQYFDWLMHCSGGLAITFFCWKLLLRYGTVFGALNIMGRRCLAFTMGCTIGMVWELLEYASDVVRGTRIQHSVSETMMDMVNDICGAATAMVLIILFAPRR
jgi:hypothetical protein